MKYNNNIIYKSNANRNFLMYNKIKVHKIFWFKINLIIEYHQTEVQIKLFLLKMTIKLFLHKMIIIIKLTIDYYRIEVQLKIFLLYYIMRIKLIIDYYQIEVLIKTFILIMRIIIVFKWKYRMIVKTKVFKYKNKMI